MLYYASAFLKELRNLLDCFSTYDIPISVEGKKIEKVSLEKNETGEYSINIVLCKTEKEDVHRIG